jgi:hypothetical protein
VDISLVRLRPSPQAELISTQFCGGAALCNCVLGFAKQEEQLSSSTYQTKYPGVPYATEKIGSAVRELVVSKETLQRRLASAYVFNVMHVIHHMRHGDKLPLRAEQILLMIERQMEQVQIDGDGGLTESIENQMSEDIARDLIGDIVEMNQCLLMEAYD